MKVLVAHPGLQHSHQVATALYETGHLLAFWSGVPLAHAADGSLRWFSGHLRPSAIPASHRRHHIIFPVLRRVAERVAPPQYANAINHRVDGLFDRWVSRNVAQLRPDIVVFYENSAFHTFGAAKR